MKLFLTNIITNIIICFFSFSAFSDTIQITGGHSDPVPIALNDFNNTDQAAASVARDIIKVISNDLESSGIFRSISKAAFIENKVGINHKPLFAAWQQINANLLLNGEITSISENKFRIKFILWDAILERKMLSESLELPKNLWRRSAHKIADRIYEKITGYRGYFNTRIVYVSESGSYFKRIKRIAIMDQDGANHQYLTNGEDLVLTPRFSPDGKEILYLSYKNGVPEVFILNIKTRKSSLIGKFKGMSFAPRFSPDGKHAIMSIAKNGSTHIYEMDLSTKKMIKLTNGSSINTSPSYSPDGSKVVFNSDMYGTRQILVMNKDGSGKKPISFGGGTYAEPSWSSKDYVAYTKISRDYGFTIGIMRPEAESQHNTERLITSGYLVESPSWASNGRMLVFTKGFRPRNEKTKGLNRIYTIDFTGHNERIVPTPHDASDPNWSNTID